MKHVLFLAALACAASANAATPKGNKVDTLQTYQLQNVLVSSTRAGKRTPMAFENVSKQQIKSINFGKDIPFLLSTTPSVTFSSDAGTGIGYTGIRVRGTDPSRINITANGVPVNDAESSQVYWVNMADMASSLESMQIQRGVGTSTNGAGAFGASINLQTENIGAKPYANVEASAGSYGTHKETVRFGTGLLNGHWGVQGRLSHIGSDGYIDRASVRLNSYFLQAGYFSDNTVVKFITFNGTEKTYHAWNYASAWEMEQFGRTYNSCGQYTEMENGKAVTKFYDNQTDNYHQQHYQLIWSQVLAPAWNLNAALHYTRGDGYYEEYKPGATWADYGLANNDADNYRVVDGVKYISTTYGDLVRRKQMGNDFYGAVASVNYNGNKGLTATLGGGWNKYIGDHYGNVIWAGAPYANFYDKDGNQLLEGGQAVVDNNLNPARLVNFEYYRNRAKKTDMNVYGKVNYEFVHGLNAYVDLQYRHINYTMQDPNEYYGTNVDGKYVINQNYNFFNPKAGLFYEINPNHKVYASFAVAHKEPTRNDFTDNAVTELKAEQLFDWELGYYFASPRFTAGVNLYYMNYKDQFVLTGELNSIGEAISRNVGKSYRMGVELQAGWKPLNWLRWDANATFSRNRAKNWTVTLDDNSTANLGDTPLSFSPNVIANNIFTFTYAGFRAAVVTQYVSKQYLSNTGIEEYTNTGTGEPGAPKTVKMTLDPYCTTNVDLSYSFNLKGFKGITVGCTVYNLFSEKYESNGWTATSYKKNSDGKVVAYAGDAYETGLSAQAPINFLAHVSLNF